MTAARNKEAYRGFEQGPIRPPSEAASLLIRVTRNCPWNRCAFCPVYKRAKFSIRPVEHVIRDIDTVHTYVEQARASMNPDGTIARDRLSADIPRVDRADSQAYVAAANWVLNGMRSVFLQDANSLVIKPADLGAILKHLRERFGVIERITSYARSQTVAKMAGDDLVAIGEAGLNRIHIGLESGSDAVLKRVMKGATKAQAIEAGQKVRRAGIELSEYVMPGLGGAELSREHALETADALNQINPDFIRLRSLAIPSSVPLFEEWQSGAFVKLTDLAVAEEMLLFIESLDGITSRLESDHILNLFEDLRGKLPEDKPRMLDMLRRFIEMPAERRMIYQVGRRLGVFRSLDDLADDDRVAAVQARCAEFGITPDNVDDMINELMARFI